jgi:hypothetical protein
MMANDYTIRFENRLYPLDKPIFPGERGGKVVVEARLDGIMTIRFGEHYLKCHEIALKAAALGHEPTAEEGRVLLDYERASTV